MSRKRKKSADDDNEDALLLRDNEDSDADATGGADFQPRAVQRKRQKADALLEFGEDIEDDELAPLSEDEKEDPSAHETADETRIRLAKEYVAKLERDKAALVCGQFANVCCIHVLRRAWRMRETRARTLLISSCNATFCKCTASWKRSSRTRS